MWRTTAGYNMKRKLIRRYVEVNVHDGHGGELFGMGKYRARALETMTRTVGSTVMQKGRGAGYGEERRLRRGVYGDMDAQGRVTAELRRGLFCRENSRSS